MPNDSKQNKIGNVSKVNPLNKSNNSDDLDLTLKS